MTFYTAQRVVSIRGKTGINAFRRTAAAPPASEAQVEVEHIEVPPGGNDVQSYLDVTAPSSLPVDVILARIDEYAAAAQTPVLPTHVGLQGIQIVFGCKLGLEKRWRDELRELARALTLLPPN